MKPDDRFFMQLCEMYAECSTCAKIKVGAVVTRSSHILSAGYNGSAPGEEHCCDHFELHPFISPRASTTNEMPNGVLDAEDFRIQHAKFSEEHEVHAEINAMADAADRGVDIRGATLYCSYLPCFNCAKEIVRRGIARVVYQEGYIRPGSATSALDYLQKFLIVEQQG
jgi:dCMP deaminase